MDKTNEMSENGMPVESPAKDLFTAIDELGVRFRKADMLRIVNEYTGMAKTQTEIDRILDNIEKMYKSPSKRFTNNLYDKFILPLTDYDEPVTIVTCVFFASLLSSYLEYTDKNKENGYLNKLLEDEVFVEEGFSKWQIELQIHIHNLATVCFNVLIDKYVEKNNDKRYRAIGKARNMATPYSINRKTEEINRKHEADKTEFVSGIQSMEESFNDILYHYHNCLSDITHYKCFDDLIDLTFLIISDPTHAYNKIEIEKKYEDIALIFQILSFDEKRTKLNENSKEIRYIYDNLTQYLTTRLNTLISGMNKGDNNTYMEAVNLLSAKKYFIQIKDKKISVLISELDRLHNERTESITESRDDYIKLYNAELDKLINEHESQLQVNLEKAKNVYRTERKRIINEHRDMIDEKLNKFKKARQME